MVACGDTHTIALASNGRLYAFGRNQNGQLGLGSSVDALAPTLVESLQVSSCLLTKKFGRTIAHEQSCIDCCICRRCSLCFLLHAMLRYAMLQPTTATWVSASSAGCMLRLCMHLTQAWMLTLPCTQHSVIWGIQCLLLS